MVRERPAKGGSGKVDSGKRDVLFVTDPLDTLKPWKDSSIAMMRELVRRDGTLWSCTPHDLHWREGAVAARVREVTLTAMTLSGKPVQGHELGAWYSKKNSGAIGEEDSGTGHDGEARLLWDFDAVLMRKDPPFDSEYLYATHLLGAAVRDGARVFNDPAALRNHNEKLAITEFSKFTAPSLVTSDAQEILAFHAQQGEIVVKPLDGMGGSGIFRIKPGDPNTNVILETSTQDGARTVMAQKYLPQIAQGDKRILLIGGKPIPYCLARIPKEGESRGNLAAGGTGRAQELSARDREIAESLAPVLLERGLLLVGLDVIGDFLTEINVTSPTCFVEIHEQSGFDVASAFVDALERQLEQPMED